MGEKLFQRVLVPINESDLSERVIDKVELMALQGILGDIYIMTVWEVNKVDYTKLHSPDKEKLLKEQANAVIEKYFGRLKGQGILVRTILSAGEPALAILKEIEKNDYDLVIMGSRHLNKIQEIIYFSVSDKVTRLSSIPVLVIK